MNFHHCYLLQWKMTTMVGIYAWVEYEHNCHNWWKSIILRSVAVNELRSIIITNLNQKIYCLSAITNFTYLSLARADDLTIDD